MKIKLNKMWLGHPAGRVLDLGKGQASELIRRKVASEYVPEEPKQKRRSPFSAPTVTAKPEAAK